MLSLSFSHLFPHLLPSGPLICPFLPPDQHTCSADRFKCKNNRCIPLRWLCDGDNDCGNDEDESNTTCSGTRSSEGGPPWEVGFLCPSPRRMTAALFALSARTCPPNQYSCASGRCIPISWTCDLDDDCGDRSDEPASCGWSTYSGVRAVGCCVCPAGPNPRSVRSLPHLFPPHPVYLQQRTLHQHKLAL